MSGSCPNVWPTSLQSQPRSQHGVLPSVVNIQEIFAQVKNGMMCYFLWQYLRRRSESDMKHWLQTLLSSFLREVRSTFPPRINTRGVLGLLDQSTVVEVTLYCPWKPSTSASCLLEHLLWRKPAVESVWLLWVGHPGKTMWRCSNWPSQLSLADVLAMAPAIWLMLPSTPWPARLPKEKTPLQ